jgi:hypothetical protein
MVNNPPSNQRTEEVARNPLNSTQQITTRKKKYSTILGNASNYESVVGAYHPNIHSFRAETMMPFSRDHDERGKASNVIALLGCCDDNRFVEARRYVYFGERPLPSMTLHAFSRTLHAKNYDTIKTL